VATSLNNLATIYAKQGRYAEAEPPLRRSLGIREKALGPDHPDVATSLINLAEIFKIRGRYANAEPLYRRSLGILEKNLGPDHPTIATAASDLGWMYLMQGRYADAELPLRRSLTIREKALGPDHPKVATSLGSLAWLYRLQRKIDDALVLTRRMSSLLASHFTVDREAASRGALAEQATRSGYFEFHVSLLAQAMQRTPQMRADATQEGFSIAQLARASSTADQVAKMAARYAAGSDALAKLARERQDALAKLEQLDSQIIRTAGQRGKETLAATLRGEEAEVTKKIAALDARLEREYPQYRELTNPKPLELAAAQKLLANDEALVLMLVSRNESFVWALRRNDAGFFKLAIKRAELVEIVKKLRKQLDLGAEDLSQILSKPFDTALAYELYHKILGPAEPLLAGVQHLIAVPDGALTSLPLGVLVTEPPTGSTDGPSGGAMPNSTRNLGVERAAAPSRQTATASVGIGTTAWLAKKTAITVLPAVSSLKALRQFASAPAGGEAFSGFGDPALEGSRGDRRQLNQAVLFSRGAIADVTEVRKIEPLPETAGELRAIARALNAPESALHFRQDATERAVKQGNLARFRNLAFATHGIMSGEFKGLAEPALVLTPPEKGSDLDDGLLTASEISQLKLDADWVVLSACNTAASDGTPGAEGLSGLARAFFYAGARSLLVSHWAVGSDAAVAITTRMFAEYAKGVSKSEALRRSLLAMMERRDNSQFAHPAFWAPFVLVGEGNTDWKK
jgi:CHAT domain-containing protein